MIFLLINLYIFIILIFYKLKNEKKVMDKIFSRKYLYTITKPHIKETNNRKKLKKIASSTITMTTVSQSASHEMTTTSQLNIKNYNLLLFLLVLLEIRNLLCHLEEKTAESKFFYFSFIFVDYLHN